MLLSAAMPVLARGRGYASFSELSPVPLAPGRCSIATLTSTWSKARLCLF